MIGALISGLFNFIIDLVVTIIQLVCSPLNALIISWVPDIADALTSIGTGLTQLLNTLPWALNILPAGLVTTLALCYTIRLAVVNMNIASHTLVRAWNVLQKLKFW